MTNSGNGWYSYTFTNITSTNLIFNDGTNQTANLSRSSNGWYLSGNWYATQPVPVTGVSVSPGTATANVGATQQLTATLTPSNATNQALTWSSSNTSVATVSGTGLVTAAASGTATITVTTQDGSYTATSAITVPSTGTTYYQILNRWQPNTYLYDGGNGQVKYGTNPSSTDQTYQWAQVNLGNGYIQLRNRSTGNYMHVENQNGSVQCGTIQSSWYSAMWSIVDAGSGWSYIENRWQANQWIHIENLLGYAQYSSAQTGWYSAMWQFVNPTVGTAAAAGLQNGAAASLTAATQASTIRLFPNPVRGSAFYITLPASQQSETTLVTIRDVTGKPMQTTSLTGSGYVQQHLPAGVYFVTIQSRMEVCTRKLIVE
jgi:hypothetical protein